MRHIGKNEPAMLKILIMVVIAFGCHLGNLRNSYDRFGSPPRRSFLIVRDRQESSIPNRFGLPEDTVGLGRGLRNDPSGQSIMFSFTYTLMYCDTLNVGKLVISNL